MDCNLPGSSVHGDTPGKNTGVGLHSLPQGLLLTQGSNMRLLHCRQILYFLSHQGSPNQTIALTPIPCCFPENTWDHQGSWCNSGVTSGPTSNSLHMTPALDWEGRTRALQTGLLHPCFCSFWGRRVPPAVPCRPWHWCVQKKAAWVPGEISLRSSACRWANTQSVMTHELMRVRDRQEFNKEESYRPGSHFTLTVAALQTSGLQDGNIFP